MQNCYFFASMNILYTKIQLFTPQKRGHNISNITTMNEMQHMAFLFYKENKHIPQFCFILL